MEQIPEEIKEKRLAILQKVIREYQIKFNEKSIGKTVKVLVERLENGQINGRSEQFQSVFADSNDESLVDQIIEVEITKVTPSSLFGIIK